MMEDWAFEDAFYSVQQVAAASGGNGGGGGEGGRFAVGDVGASLGGD